MNQWLFQAPLWMLLVIPGLAVHWAARIVRGQERQVGHSHRLLEMLGWGFLAWAGVGLALLLVVPWNWPLIPLLLTMLLSGLYVRRRWHQTRMLHAWETLRLEGSIASNPANGIDHPSANDRLWLGAMAQESPWSIRRSIGTLGSQLIQSSGKYGAQVPRGFTPAQQLQLALMESSDGKGTDRRIEPATSRTGWLVQWEEAYRTPLRHLLNRLAYHWVVWFVMTIFHFLFLWRLFPSLRSMGAWTIGPGVGNVSVAAASPWIAGWMTTWLESGPFLIVGLALFAGFLIWMEPQMWRWAAPRWRPGHQREQRQLALAALAVPPLPSPQRLARLHLLAAQHPHRECREEGAKAIESLESGDDWTSALAKVDWISPREAEQMPKANTLAAEEASRADRNWQEAAEALVAGRQSRRKLWYDRVLSIVHAVLTLLAAFYLSLPAIYFFQWMKLMIEQMAAQA
jgi:hypothetical protein